MDTNLVINEDLIASITAATVKAITSELVEPLQLTGGAVADKDITITNGHAFKLTTYGQQIFDECLEIYPEPIYFRGAAGMGKSIIAKALAKAKGLDMHIVAGQDQMRLGDAVGNMYPDKDENGAPTIEWRDGVITKAVRSDSILLFEEISRAPQAVLDSMFQLMDTDNRSYHLMANNETVQVGSKFWILATGNPVGSGYKTKSIDKALNDRFVAKYDFNEPMAPEREIIGEYMSDHLADGLMKFAADCRNNKDTFISTRDLVKAARLISKPMFNDNPIRAIELAITSSYDKLGAGMLAIARQLVTTEPAIEPAPEPTPNTGEPMPEPVIPNEVSTVVAAWIESHSNNTPRHASYGDMFHNCKRGGFCQSERGFKTRSRKDRNGVIVWSAESLDSGKKLNSIGIVQATNEHNCDLMHGDKQRWQSARCDHATYVAAALQVFGS